MKKLNRSRGFTLIELMTVVVIIAILSSIILVALSSSRGKARDAQRVSDLGQLQLALTLFNDRCGQYPVNIPSSGALSTSLTAPTCPTNTVTGTAYKLGDFIATIPTPPAGAGQASYFATIYYTTNRVNGTGNNYVLVAALESSNAAMSKGLAAGSVNPVYTDGHWWPLSSGSSPVSNCGPNAVGGYYYYCIVPN